MKHLGGIPELTTRAKIGAGLILFVFIAAIAVFFVTSAISRQISGSGVAVQDFTKKDTVARKTDALSSANAALKSGDEQTADKIYEQAIGAEPDSTKKVKLAIDQSYLLYGASKYDEAIAVAKKAESYSSDKYLVADWLGQLYETKKQYTEAASYYELAGTLAKSPTNDKGYVKKYYDGKVASMKSQASKG